MRGFVQVERLVVLRADSSLSKQLKMNSARCFSAAHREDGGERTPPNFPITLSLDAIVTRDLR